VLSSLARGTVPCHTSRVHLSRPRILLRATLLAVGGAFMLAKAWEARSAAAEPGAGDALLLQRIALVEALVGVLAIAAAVIALLALRPRRRRQTLRLKDLDRP
jgi:hypothetical protein